MRLSSIIFLSAMSFLFNSVASAEKSKVTLKKECTDGNKTSCFLIGYSLANEGNETDAAEYLESACYGDVANGCILAGLIAAKAKRKSFSERLLERACGLDKIHGCRVLGEQRAIWEKSERADAQIEAMEQSYKRMQDTRNYAPEPQRNTSISDALNMLSNAQKDHSSQKKIETNCKTRARSDIYGKTYYETNCESN